MDLGGIKVLYRDRNMMLWGIPYDMRPGQSPRDLQDAYLDYVPPRYGTYGSKRIDLSDWVRLTGTFEPDEAAAVAAFLSQFPKGAIPAYPFEWTKI